MIISQLFLKLHFCRYVGEMPGFIQDVLTSISCIVTSIGKAWNYQFTIYESELNEEWWPHVTVSKSSSKSAYGVIQFIEYALV
jgi:hypothetical protein